MIAAAVFVGLAIGMLLGNQPAWLMLFLGIALLLEDILGMVFGIF